MSRSFVINKYNQSMGGVDLHDRMVSFYPIAIRSNKWTIRLFFHFIDMALVNSWLEYRRDQEDFKRKPMTYLKFKMYVGESLSVSTSGTIDQSDSIISTSDDQNEAIQPTKKVPQRLLITEKRKVGAHLPKAMCLKTL